MAQPFIVLGLKGANKLIDKHFDKVPDAALHPETYHPANITSKEHRKKTRQKRAAKNKTGSSSSSDDEESTEEVEEVTADPEGVDIKLEQRGAPRNMFSPPQSATYPPPPLQQEAYVPSAPIYSREPPRMRPEYAPSPPPIGSGYPYAQGAYAPPPFQPQAIDRRERRDSDDDEDYYSESYRHPRRPKTVTRRSSSYHGPRSGSGFETVDKARDKAHRNKLKEEMEGMFTKSKEGLAGGAVGALVGGWAARKAQEAKGRDKHPASPILTLLGAAVGGLAVNAVIEKYEVAHGKDGSETKSGGEGSRDRNGGSDAGRSQTSHRSRRSRRDTRYDDGYGSDEDSDGDRSYRSERSHRKRRESRSNMSDGYD